MIKRTSTTKNFDTKNKNEFIRVHVKRAALRNAIRELFTVSCPTANRRFYEYKLDLRPGR